MWQKNRTSQKLTLTKPPQKLFVHLLRFYYDRWVEVAASNVLESEGGYAP